MSGLFKLFGGKSSEPQAATPSPPPNTTSPPSTVPVAAKQKTPTRRSPRRQPRGTDSEPSSPSVSVAKKPAPSPASACDLSSPPPPAPAPPAPPAAAGTQSPGSPASASAFTPTKATKEGTERLFKEFHSIVKAPEYKTCGYEIEPDDDNIYKWLVQLRFDEGQIVEDLKIFKEAMGKDHVLMEVIFPPNFPQSPPFMRICYPRFHQYTGHITIGGSICIQELTHSGWNSSFELQTFLVMIRNLLIEGGALIDMDNLSEYTEAEARGAFRRVAMQHGWKP